MTDQDATAPVNYRVTVSHVAAPWKGVHAFVVKGDAHTAHAPALGFYARAAHFGCGKDYPSREAAIVGLVRDNGGVVESIEGLPVPTFA